MSAPSNLNPALGSFNDPPARKEPCGIPRTARIDWPNFLSNSITPNAQEEGKLKKKQKEMFGLAHVKDPIPIKEILLIP